jgi:hypothetical protein
MRGYGCEASVAKLVGGTLDVMTQEYRDHDHAAEDAFLAYLDHPTPGQAHETELAIARLQRRYDHLLRRLDGDGEPPEVPLHRHNAGDDPVSCLEAVLHELAGARLADRAGTLAHGLEAVRALAWQADEARRYARLLYQQVTFGSLDYDAFDLPADAQEWPTWLTYYDGWHPERQGPVGE